MWAGSPVHQGARVWNITVSMPMKLLFISKAEKLWFIDEIFQSLMIYSKTCVKRPLKYRQNKDLKGDSNPNDKYDLSERALGTMHFDTNIIKIS